MALLRPLFPRQCLVPSSPPPHRPPGGMWGVAGPGNPRPRWDLGVPPGCLSTQASPPALCPRGRTRDLDAVLAVMKGARKFIYASVMDYFPTTRFSHPAR